MDIWVGVDWGFEHCQVHVEDGAGAKVEDVGGRVATKPKSLTHLLNALVKLVDRPSQLQVGIERATGRVVEHFLAAGCTVYNVNPAKVDLGRQLVSMSNAKDDERDARVLARVVRSFPEAFQPLVPMDPLSRALRQTSRQRHALVKQRTQLRNRLGAALREYYPAMLELGSFETQWQTVLLGQLPTPEAAKLASVSDVSLVLRKHRSRQKAGELLETLRQPAPVVGADFVEAMGFEVPMWADQLLLVMKQIASVERRIEGLLNTMDDESEQAGPSDVEIARSLPGVGSRTLASIIGEGLLSLARDDLRAARCVSGVAPVTETTGKRQRLRSGKVVMRRACNHYVRDTLHQVVLCALPNHPEIKARFESLRARGQTVGAACRRIADQLIRALHAMLRDRTLYGHPASG